MTERPILFSGPMVRAILADTKTQTRRVVRWPVLGPSDGRKRRVYTESDVAEINGTPQLCPYGSPGDYLWVRETWAEHETDDVQGTRTYYRADHADGEAQVRPGMFLRWTPSIHMPRNRSRITLRVASVRVERLHAITMKDIVAEGVRVPVSEDGKSVLVRCTGSHPPAYFLDMRRPRTPEDYLRAEWASLWSEINGRASWDANPWVWRVEFWRRDNGASS